MLPFCFSPISITSCLRRKDTRLSTRVQFAFWKSLGTRLDKDNVTANSLASFQTLFRDKKTSGNLKRYLCKFEIGASIDGKLLERERNKSTEKKEESVIPLGTKSRNVSNTSRMLLPLDPYESKSAYSDWAGGLS